VQYGLKKHINLKTPYERLFEHRRSKLNRVKSTFYGSKICAGNFVISEEFIVKIGVVA